MICGKMACGIAARSIPVVGVTLTAYDPAFDAEAGKFLPVVGRLLIDFLAALERI